jgi:hypothetical protein
MRFRFIFLILFWSASLLAGCTGPEAQAAATATTGLRATQTLIPPTETRPAAPTASVPPAIPEVTQTLSLPLILTSPPAATPSPLVRFAVIGDYGDGGQPEADVAALVNSWQPDFVITTGDNNYPNGASDSIDTNIGQFYQSYIYPYLGTYGQGAEVNRFFPTLGNHDWNTSAAQPYLDYFTLPGNERYYDFTWGPLHLFALDSDSREPDGVGQSTTQAAWLQTTMAGSTSPWNVVYFHHAPYSSGEHGSIAWARWPYKDWGASVVLAGHDHTYERLLVDGLPYFVNGLGGSTKYRFVNILPESQVRYNADYGAMLVQASDTSIIFQFYNRQDELIDTYTLEK